VANEITYTAVANERVAAVLHQQLWSLSYDATDLRQKGIVTKVPHPADGSSVLKVPVIDRAYVFAAPGEQTASANTAISDATFSLTAARYDLKFNPSQLAHITSPSGGLLVDLLVELIDGAVGQTFTDLIVALFASFSKTAGGGADVDMRVDDFLDGIYSLHVYNAQTYPDGGFKSVLKHHSFNELISSLRSETGSFSLREDVRNVMGAGSPGFKGRLAGVDIISCDSCTEASSKTQNGMFGPLAMAYSETPVSKVVPFVDRKFKVTQGGACFVTTAYNEGTGGWNVRGNYWPAVSEAEDDNAVLIESDDT
jgi:hypothetical protein